MSEFLKALELGPVDPEEHHVSRVRRQRQLAGRPTIRPMTPAPKALPAIDPARCTGCGWCVGACPPHVLSLETLDGKKTSTLHEAPACTGCAKCAVVCPFGAITMVRRTGLRA
jgi:ferredoxin